MTTRTFLNTVAALAMLLLGNSMAVAQVSDVLAKVEDLQQRYEEAVATGNYEEIGSLYAENAIYSPMPGGIIEGPEGIWRFYEGLGVKTLDMHSSRTEAVGENLILDIGTLTATLPAGEAGGIEVQGEYVTLIEDGENGPRIRSATAFPVRQAPDALTQQ